MLKTNKVIELIELAYDAVIAKRTQEWSDDKMNETLNERDQIVEWIENLSRERKLLKAANAKLRKDIVNQRSQRMGIMPPKKRLSGADEND